MNLRVAFVLLLFVSAAAAQSADRASRTKTPGFKTFDAYCTACHQYDAQGMGEAPPLKDSEWVEGPEERLIKIVLHGVRGEMRVQGKTYNREMPGFGPILSDREIAELLTFVRRSFGKPSSAISEAAVRRVRERYPDRRSYWRIEEFEQ